MSGRIEEVLKGVFVFIIGNLFFYFAWTIFHGMLTQLTEVSGYLGVFGWISFIFIYLFTVPIYSIYAIISGSNGKSTNIVEVGKAIGMWFVGMIALLILFYLFFYTDGGLIGVLEDTVISGNGTSIGANGGTTAWSNSDAISVVSGIGSLAVIITMLCFTIVPFYFILKGYGILERDVTT